ncbi:CHRD domain-containing protein [Bythopirellula goksoeyrii]|uniref:CHRD domain protein n=1 Tax=Bythopirellula goksoeyrii TaxID=1400387 RepID=A0A5B9Q6R4_9BACT|nr:CHRD domain-containing protein [Bythopirellula goksoeyrii]QEG34714.1 CHRD domain protein [Bythopirellula goksoeyrii]
MISVLQHPVRKFVVACSYLIVALALLENITNLALAEVLIWGFSIDESQIKNGPEVDGSTNSPATGSGRFEYNTNTNVISYEITWSNLFGALTKLHVHGPADATSSNPSHIIEIFGPPDIPGSVDLNSDTWSDSHTLEALQQTGINPMTNQPYDPITPAQIIAIMESGQSYLNVHTDVFGMGEIRGNLGLPVPEPASLGLLAIGVIMVSFRRSNKPCSRLCLG